jgi:hypothetical protein
MAESNIPNTGDPRVDAALKRIHGKFTDLKDALIVQAQPPAFLKACFL